MEGHAVAWPDHPRRARVPRAADRDGRRLGAAAAGAARRRTAPRRGSAPQGQSVDFAPRRRRRRLEVAVVRARRNWRHDRRADRALAPGPLGWPSGRAGQAQLVRRPPAVASTALLAALALSPGAASAQEPAPPPTGSGGQNIPNASGGGQAFADPSQLFSGEGGAFIGVGIGKIDGDVYATTLLNTDFSLGPVGVGLGLPLNLLVRNDASTGTRESKTYGGLVRRRDFDQFENYLRVIRYVSYGHKRDELYVLAGQHWGSSIGHGTWVNRYNNALNLDRAKPGRAL